VRLNDHEITSIKAAAREAFGETVIVRLFGSRVDDSLRGGDIDLHFEVDDGQQDYRHAGAFKWKLFEKIDERKIDMVFHVRGRDLRPIDRVAFDEGIRL
jgi:predicted nucleotidyltransferase